MPNNDEGKWARARAIAAEDEAYKDEYAWHKHEQALASRFRSAGPAEVLRMFEAGVNEKGQPLSQIEFEALCDHAQSSASCCRWARPLLMPSPLTHCRPATPC
jgi:hypothetical protein